MSVNRIAIVVLGVAIVGCAGACVHSAPDPAVVATYSGGVVTKAELKSFLSHRGLEAGEIDRRSAVESMLIVQTLAESIPLGEVSDDVALWIADEQDAMLLKALRRRVSASVEISDDEIDHALEETPDAFVMPRRVRLRNVFMFLPPDASPEDVAATRLRMARVRDELAAGADWGAVAGRESDSQTRFRGGVVGNVRPGELPPVLDAAAMSLAPGEISDVLEVDDGLVILGCEKILPPKVPGVEEQRQKVEKALRRAKVERALNDLHEDLLAEAAARHHIEGFRAPSPDAVVLEIGDMVVTRAEAEDLVRRRSPVAQRFDSATPERLHTVLEALTERRQAGQKARAEGLDRETEIAASLRWTRADILTTEAMRRRVDAQIEPPSDEEIREYFEANRDRYQRPDRYRLSGIQILDPDIEQAHRLALMVSRALDRGQLTFDEAVQQYSSHSSVGAAGDLGWFSGRGFASLGPELGRIVKGLSPGEVGPAVRNGDAFWLVRLEAFEPRRALTLDEAAEHVKQSIGTERVARLQATIEESVRRELEVVLSATSR